MGQRWQTEESRNVGAQQELEEQCVAIWLQVRHKCCHASSGKLGQGQGKPGSTRIPARPRPTHGQYTLPLSAPGRRARG